MKNDFQPIFRLKFRLKFIFRSKFDLKTVYFQAVNSRILGSIVVSIPACHAGDPGSIPGRGVSFVLSLPKHTLHISLLQGNHTSQAIPLGSSCNSVICSTFTQKKIDSTPPTSLLFNISLLRNDPAEVWSKVQISIEPSPS